MAMATTTTIKSGKQTHVTDVPKRSPPPNQNGHLDNDTSQRAIKKRLHVRFQLEIMLGLVW